MYVSKHLEASESRGLDARIGTGRSAWYSRWSGRLSGEKLAEMALIQLLRQCGNDRLVGERLAKETAILVSAE